MKNKLIALATEIAKSDFATDYDDSIELTIADAITILIMENISHNDEIFMDCDSSEVYDFISKQCII
jgi:hypothetical protein